MVRKATPVSFLAKLYQLLEAEDPSIIHWLPDGRAFQILDPQRLSSEVMSKYFRHNKFSSFQRQLNYFGFKKASSTKNTWIYNHPLFVRGQPEGLLHIKRRTHQPNKAPAAAAAAAHAPAAAAAALQSGGGLEEDDDGDYHAPDTAKSRGERARKRRATRGAIDSEDEAELRADLSRSASKRPRNSGRDVRLDEREARGGGRTLVAQVGRGDAPMPMAATAMVSPSPLGRSVSLGTLQRQLDGQYFDRDPHLMPCTPLSRDEARPGPAAATAKVVDKEQAAQQLLAAAAAAAAAAKQPQPQPQPPSQPPALAKDASVASDMSVSDNAAEWQHWQGAGAADVADLLGATPTALSSATPRLAAVETEPSLAARPSRDGSGIEIPSHLAAHASATPAPRVQQGRPLDWSAAIPGGGAAPAPAAPAAPVVAPAPAAAAMPPLSITPRTGSALLAALDTPTASADMARAASVAAPDLPAVKPPAQAAADFTPSALFADGPPALSWAHAVTG